MTSATASPSTAFSSAARSNSLRSLRGGRTALVALFVAAGTAAAVLTGGGTAAADPIAPYVVGMTEQQAHEALATTGVPYRNMVRIGGASPCIVTAQSDLGTVLVGHTNLDGDRIETPVWRGVGLSVRCA
ncbi:hypothetical protein [Millisia brevis]|uniref:hypothetical protein n=1 Tax=Millisia brevis TaxID=264148 RepID=UPI001FE084D1|nr:hypothetical protein [Millisia brevis]